MTFRLGQEVVCVDDGSRVSRRRAPRWFGFIKETKEPLQHNLNAGETYIVTWVGPHRDWRGDEHSCICVDRASHFAPHHHVPFPAWQFAEVKRKQTSIEIFRAMLVNPPKVGVDA